MVERGGQRVDIAARLGVPGVAAILFQGSVERCAAPLYDGHRHFIGEHLLHQSEVDELDQSGGRALDIAGLDVAMNDGRVLMMHVVEGVKQLQRPAHDHLDIQELLGAARLVHERLQVLARHEIHDQVVAAGLAEVVRHFGQVGVVEASQDRGFAVELLATFLSQARRQVGIVFDLLYGTDAPGQAPVFGLVDGAHAPSADDVLDYVAIAQGGAGGQGGGHLRRPGADAGGDSSARGDYTCGTAPRSATYGPG